MNRKYESAVRGCRNNSQIGNLSINEGIIIK
jgi:hypothetical protein